MLEQVRLELELESYVSFNGQYVMHQGELIHSNPICSEALEQLSAFAELSGHPLVYLDHSQMSCSQEYHPHVDLCLTSLGVTYPGFSKSFCTNRLIYQTMLFCSPEEETVYRERFRDLHFVRWHPLSMDVLPAGGSKAEGVSRLADRLGFSLNRCMLLAITSMIWRCSVMQAVALPWATPAFSTTTGISCYSKCGAGRDLAWSEMGRIVVKKQAVLYSTVAKI